MLIGVFILLLNALLVFTSPVPPYKVCSGPHAHFHTYPPDIINNGNENSLVFNISGYLDEEVVGGNEEIDIRLGGFPVPPMNLDLQDLPWKKGDKTFTFNFTDSPIPPPRKTTIRDR